MLMEIEKNIWFDSDSIKIWKGEKENRRECMPVPSKKHVPSVQDENWRPTLIYIAAAACNLKCKYCYAGEGTYGIKAAKRQLTYEEYVETYTKMRELYKGIKAISFFGGEPLLNFREIKKFVEYLHETYPPEELPELSVNTNGTILNEEILDFLCRYHFVIGTSIDGSRDVHDENRIGHTGASTYDIVVKNIGTLHEKGLRVYVQYTFTKQHLDKYVPGMAEKWCRDMERLPIETYELIPVSSNEAAYRLDMADSGTQAAYKAFVSELADYYLTKLLKEDIQKVPRMFVGLLTRLLLQMEQHECSAGHSFSITPGKQIFPCHTFTEHTEFGMHIDEINSSADLQKNAAFVKVQKANRENNAACRGCVAGKVCGVWCKGLQNSLKGDAGIPLDERCILMQIFTEKIIVFLATQYETNKAVINRKIIAYNKLHGRKRENQT